MKTESQTIRQSCYAIHEADGQDVTMQNDLAYALVAGGGKPGQGYPCIMVIDEDTDGKKIF